MTTVGIRAITPQSPVRQPKTIRAVQVTKMP